MAELRLRAETAALTILGLTILAVLTTALGRLVARVARVSWLDRMHPDILPIQAALGTAVLTCLCAAASHAGLGQRRALVPIAVACAALVAWALRTRPARRPLLRCRGSAWWPLAIALGAACIVGLLPILWFHSFTTFNDAFFYNANADWLVAHGVSEPAPHLAMRPVLTQIITFQELGFRLGSSYVQALLTVLVGASHAILVFYAVSCWGFILLAACCFSLGRHVFRLSPWICTAAVGTLVCVPAAESHALQAGFQAQLYGLCALVALLCCLTRMRSIWRAAWRPGGCIVLGVLLAWQASAYSELLPVALLVTLVGLVVSGRRAGARRSLASWARSVAVSAAAFALAGNAEIVRAAVAIPVQMDVSVGWHIAATASTWLGFLTGASVYPAVAEMDPLVNPLALFGAPLLIVGLCVAGLLRRSTRRHALVASAAIVVLGAAAAWFACCVRDPWAHAPPHTWSLFKVTQWLHPLVVVGAWAGVAGFLRTPRAARIAAAGSLLLVASGLPLHVRYAETISFSDMSQFTGDRNPEAQLARLSTKMAELSGRSLYVATRPGLTNPRFVELLGYFTLHSPAWGLWTGCNYIYGPPITWLRPEVTDVAPPAGTFTLLCHQSHFPIPGARQLGCHVAAVTPEREPILCQVSNANGLQLMPDGLPYLWIGGPATVFVVFAPRAGHLSLAFDAHRGPGAASLLRHLEVSNHDTTVPLTVDFGSPSGAQRVTLAADLAAGINEIRLACTDAMDGSQPAAMGDRPLLLSFSEPQLSFD